MICAKCGAIKDAKGSWCPNYRSHGMRYRSKAKRPVVFPRKPEGAEILSLTLASSSANLKSNEPRIKRR